MKVKNTVANKADSEVHNNSVIKNSKKDPVCQLTENVGKILWNKKLVTGVHNRCCFTASTTINGNRLSATSTTWKTAKNLCAEKALNQILGDKTLSNCKAIYGQKTGLPTINDEVAEQNYGKNKRNEKLPILQNITNLQLNSNLDTAGKRRNLKITKDKSNFETEYDSKVSKPAANLSKSNQYSVVTPSVLPLTLKKVKDDSSIVNDSIEKLATYREQNELLLDCNKKISDDIVSTRIQPVVKEVIEDNCTTPEQNKATNLPSSSGSNRYVFEINTNANDFGSQAICDSKDAKPEPVMNLGSMPRSNLNIFKSTTESNSSVDKINVQQIEMEVCDKSLPKNPFGDENLLPDKAENGKQNLKRLREDSMELKELPPAKIHATDENNVLSRRRLKNAIHNLKKLQPNLRFTLEAEVGNSTEHKFIVSAMVSKRKFYGHGKSRSLAKNDAAIQILNYLKKKSLQSTNNGQPPTFPSNSQKGNVLHNECNNEIYSSFLLPSEYADIIESKIMQAFDKLTCGHEEFSSYKVLAGIIMTFHMDFNNSTIISIATGTKCVNGGKICRNGSVLNDSHAEVIAKRGLRKFLFSQLINHCSYETMENSVFERTPIGYQLKPFVHFHLYINTAPCGDGRVFNFNYTSSPGSTSEASVNSVRYGQLRTKIEGELGTAPIGSRFYPQTWNGIVSGKPLHTMSCSDKIALWNVVGIQGALLSQFVQPIYLQSITLGSLFNAEHMYRAIFGRIQNCLPQSYSINRPLLGYTSMRLRRHTYIAPRFGINWTWGDNDIEIIYLTSGRTTSNDTSFLSKKAFFIEYFYLCNNLPTLHRIPFSNTYAKAKQIAQDYQIAKRKVYETFNRANLGKWIKKPREQNEFAINVNELFYTYFFNNVFATDDFY